MLYRSFIQLLILSLSFSCVEKTNQKVADIQGELSKLPLGEKQVTMLAFVDIAADIETKALSKAIVNHAISILDQYRLNEDKLELIIVDNSFVKTGRETKRETLLNYQYDLNTKFKVRIYSNNNEELSKYYQVNKSGTLILVKNKTQEVKRWTQQFNPGTLAIEIEKALDLDLHFQ